MDISTNTIEHFVDLKFVGTMQPKNRLSYIVTSFVKPIHCFTEHLMLLRGGIELNHQGLKRCIEDCIHKIYMFGCAATAGYVPPRPEVRGFRYPYTPGAFMKIAERKRKGSS